MSTGAKLARAFARRLEAFKQTAATLKDTTGIKCPGGKPGSYHSCDTLPTGKGRSKGGPSETMARLRALAKSKGQKVLR